MKKFGIVLLLFFAGFNLSAQNLTSSFTFVWETGEYSMDAQFNDFLWKWDGKVMTYETHFSGRNPGPPDEKKSPKETQLTKEQENQMAQLLAALTSEKTISLLPKGFQGSFESYSLKTRRNLVEADSPAYLLDQSTGKLSRDPAKKPIPSAKAAALMAKFVALRDYLLTLDGPI